MGFSQTQLGYRRQLISSAPSHLPAPNPRTRVSQAQVKDMLRELAFILNATRRISEEIRAKATV